MPPSLANGMLATFAHYKLQTNGAKMLSLLDDGTGRINIDTLESSMSKFMSNVGDQTFHTVVGDFKVKSDTPKQIVDIMKKYGEN